MAKSKKRDLSAEIHEGLDSLHSIDVTRPDPDNFTPFGRDPALDQISQKDAEMLKGDLLEGLEAPPVLQLTEVEMLRRRLCVAELHLVQAELTIKQYEKDALLAKIDPEGKLAQMDKQRAEKVDILKKAVESIGILEADVMNRLGIKDINEYTIDDDGKLIEKVPQS